MARGIGIDTVSIDEFEQLCEGPENSDDPLSGPFVTYMFTEREIESARRSPKPFETLAGLFAVKEATFKAVAHLLPEKHFDLRIVETLHANDGCPYVNTDAELANVLVWAGITELFVSITNEAGLATAIVLAQ